MKCGERKDEDETRERIEQDEVWEKGRMKMRQGKG